MSHIMRTNVQISKRIDWIDFAKAIGIFLIVFGHSIKGTIAHTFVYSFHVPLFFYLTGSTFGCRNVYGKFLVKRFKTLLVPYCAVMAVSIVIFYFMGSFTADSLNVNTVVFSWKDYILGSLYGNYKTGFLKANSPLWFLPCIFVVQNLMYGIVKLTEKLKKPIFGALTALALSILICYLNYYVLKIRMLPFAIETAFYVLPYTLLGYVLSKYKLPKLSRLLSVSISVVLFGACLALCYFFNVICKVGYDQYSNLSLCFVTALCGIFAVVFLCKAIPSSKPLSYLGKNTMVILLLHKFPILFFQVIFKPTVEPMKNNFIPVCIVVAIISVVMCLIAGEIIKIICPWLIGASRKKKGTKEQNKA